MATPCYLATSALAVNPALYPKLSFDTVTSFSPVVLAAVVPNVMVMHPGKVAARTIPELIALARTRPGGAELRLGRQRLGRAYRHGRLRPRRRH